jgi:diketogulonate reductase-like aldo/keto reductase
MKKIELGWTKENIPILGQGTWGISRFFKDIEYYEQWKDSLRTGIELGMTHIDTAEFYGWGKAEEIVGEVVEEYDREEVFITSKLFPVHMRKKTMEKAAEKSLERLGIDYFDLYLIHWPNPLVSIEKQMNVLETLVKKGKTRYIGVSNFSLEQFKKAQNLLKTEELVTNQLKANIVEQKFMDDSLSYFQKNDIIMTAYSPLSHGGFTDIKKDLKEKLGKVAKKHDATIQQIAIAWLINHKNVITIPKAFHTDHVKQNAKAASIQLTEREIKLFYSKNFDFDLRYSVK